MIPDGLSFQEKLMGRWIVIAAVCCYGLVVGCVMLTGHKGETGRYAGSYHRPTSVPAGLPYRGVAMQIQRVDWIDKYEQSEDEIADLGADTVLLVIDSRQENGSSSHIYLDMRMTPTPDQLGELIDHAKKRKLRVILMPIVLLDNPSGNEWRGTLKPDSWDKWFDSYRDMMTQFAWIAQGHGVDVLVVGSELVSSEPNVEQWTRTIAKVRESYHGNLTYSANWDHYDTLGFWDQLDLIGMNSYYKLGENNKVTTEEIETRWREIQTKVVDFSEKEGKPALFLEAGWCSLQNAANEPWDYTQSDLPADDDLQKRLYEAFFNVWYGNPHLGGFMMWEWPPGDDTTGKGYTPKGKPAEQVMREWFAKKPWKVE
jgi:hypothetical protein